MLTKETMPRTWDEVKPGTEIEEDLYWEMFDCMPPGMLKNHIGFQVLEPYDHKIDGSGNVRARYMTFTRTNTHTEEERYYYAGIFFRGECAFEIKEDGKS